MDQNEKAVFNSIEQGERARPIQDEPAEKPSLAELYAPRDAKPEIYYLYEGDREVDGYLSAADAYEALAGRPMQGMSLTIRERGSEGAVLAEKHIREVPNTTYTGLASRETVEIDLSDNMKRDLVAEGRNPDSPRDELKQDARPSLIEQPQAAPEAASGLSVGADLSEPAQVETTVTEAPPTEREVQLAPKAAVEQTASDSLMERTRAALNAARSASTLEEEADHLGYAAELQNARFEAEEEAAQAANAELEPVLVFDASQPLDDYTESLISDYAKQEVIAPEALEEYRRNARASIESAVKTQCTTMAKDGLTYDALQVRHEVAAEWCESRSSGVLVDMAVEEREWMNGQSQSEPAWMVRLRTMAEPATSKSVDASELQKKLLAATQATQHAADPTADVKARLLALAGVSPGADPEQESTTPDLLITPAAAPQQIATPGPSLSFG